MIIENLRFRPAQARDVEDAVLLIYSSGPDAFDYVFANDKGDASRFLKKAFADGAGEFGYRNHIVGTIDGRVVCAGAGYTSDTGFAFTLSAVRQIIGFYGLFASVRVIRNGLLIEDVIKPPTGDMYYIGHLGVHPDLRGQGIGTALVKHLLLPQYTAGCPVAVLDVSVMNPRAEALYKRLGFEVTELCESDLSNQWGKVISLNRMEKTL